MDESITPSRSTETVLGLISAGAKLEQRLDRSLSGIKGITFSEYRLLEALAAASVAEATRVELARSLDMSPSGVTRALKPLEKLGFVETVRDNRDARRSAATLTPQGVELLNDAAGVVRDTIETMPGLAEITGKQTKAVLAIVDGILNG